MRQSSRKQIRLGLGFGSGMDLRRAKAAKIGQNWEQFYNKLSAVSFTLKYTFYKHLKASYMATIWSGRQASFQQYSLIQQSILQLYQYIIQNQFRMQAIGSEVILALTPLIILLSVTIYYLFPKIKDYVANMRRPAQVREDPVEVHPRFGQGACSICLQPKRYEVSATCGHSFCGRCIIQLYERWNDRIQCPLCRRVMTTMFRGFDERYGQQRQRTRIMNQIHGYNQRFDDNRPLWRRIRELPTVLRRLRPIIMSPYFIILFIRSIYFLRFLFFFIFYLLVPYDILPQSVLGAIGFLDDIFIGIFILLFVFTTFGLLFIRGRH